MAKERGIGLVSKLDFGPEYREDGGTTAPVETGRFKYFREVAKRRNSPLLIANLMFIITLIPLFVLLVLIEVFGGLEGLAEKFTGIKDPYLLGNVGMGFSQTEHSVLEIKLNMLNVYYVIFAIIGVIAIPVSVGFGGMLHLSGKFIIGDSFISKKDKFGNDVPRAIKE